MDTNSTIKHFNAGRDAQRLQRKYDKMRSSPFAFFRGSCHLFFAQLPRGGIFKSAPAVWSCGDLHVENFGSYKGDNRLVFFDINDFDESALSPASWDLLRFVTSVRLGAKGIGLRGRVVHQLCAVFLQSYCAALVQGKAYWLERDTSQGLIGDLLQGLRNRERSTLLAERTTLKGKKRSIKIDQLRALAATDAQRKRVLHFMKDFAKTQAKPEFYKVIDVARRIAGNGSLGLQRYVILVRGKGGPDGHYLLDLKQAVPSSLTAHLKTAQPHWASDAQRIVSLQQRLQAVSVAFLQAVTLDGQPYVLRDLQPSEDRISWDKARHSKGDIEDLIRTMGQLTAWSHLRASGRQGAATADDLIDFAQRTKWQDKLLAHSEAMAKLVERDAAQFNAAYDAGFFKR
jgi:uncharacterized protein (DUF2252 family)